MELAILSKSFITVKQVVDFSESGTQLNAISCVRVPAKEINANNIAEINTMKHSLHSAKIDIENEILLLNGSGLFVAYNNLHKFISAFEVASTQQYAIYALTLNVEALCGDNPQVEVKNEVNIIQNDVLSSMTNSRNIFFGTALLYLFDRTIDKFVDFNLSSFQSFFNATISRRFINDDNDTISAVISNQKYNNSNAVKLLNILLLAADCRKRRTLFNMPKIAQLLLSKVYIEQAEVQCNASISYCVGRNSYNGIVNNYSNVDESFTKLSLKPVNKQFSDYNRVILKNMCFMAYPAMVSMDLGTNKRNADFKEEPVTCPNLQIELEQADKENKEPDDNCECEDCVVEKVQSRKKPRESEVEASESKKIKTPTTPVLKAPETPVVIDTVAE